VTLHEVATAIELEASYQSWRAQHERYLLLSRRVWLNDAARKVREFEPHSQHFDYGDHDPAADSYPGVKVATGGWPTRRPRL
jgi:hypothetical protein